MNVFKIIKNIGLFIKFAKSVGEVFKFYTKEKKISSGLSSVAISDFEEILKSGAIDFPGVDEVAIASSIEQIRKNLIG